MAQILMNQCPVCEAELWVESSFQGTTDAIMRHYYWHKLERLAGVTDMASNNPEASAELSNPPKESL